MQTSPVLVREVIRVGTRGPRLGVILGATVAVTVAMGVVIGPAVMRNFSESKAQVAQLTVNTYVRDAYPQWLATHVKRCPAQLSALDELMNFRGTHDPWGEPYQMLCDERGGIVVYSKGEDGVLGTHDDIWSRP